MFHCTPTRFSCAIIPHTHHVTTLHRRKPGDHVNIEVDMQGKYIEKFVQDAVARALTGPLQELRDELAHSGSNSSNGQTEWANRG